MSSLRTSMCVLFFFSFANAEYIAEKLNKTLAKEPSLKPPPNDVPVEVWSRKIKRKDYSRQNSFDKQLPNAD